VRDRREAALVERVVLPHLDAAANLARHLMQDPALAQDVVQEAVMRALRYAGTYRGGDGRAWLLQIVRHTAFDALARRRTAAEEPLPDGDGAFEPIDPADGPEAACSRAEDLAQLDLALSRLSPELRECLVLRELEGMAYRDIARVTGLPIGTVMSRLWRARRAMLDGPERRGA